jgi:hypothetical protein
MNVITNEWTFDEEEELNLDPSKRDCNLASELIETKGKKRTASMKSADGDDDEEAHPNEENDDINPNRCFIEFERDKICAIVDQLFTAKSDSIHDEAIFNYIKKQQLAEKNKSAKCEIFKLFMNTKDDVNINQSVKDQFYYGSFETELDKKRFADAQYLVDSIKNVNFFNSASKEKKTWDFNFDSVGFGILIASTPSKFGDYEGLTPFNFDNAARQVCQMVLDKCVEYLKEKQAKWRKYIQECREENSSIQMSAELKRTAEVAGLKWLPSNDREFLEFLNNKDINTFCEIDLEANYKPFYISRIFKRKDNKLRSISIDKDNCISSSEVEQLKSGFYSGKAVLLKVTNTGRAYLQFYSKIVWFF